MIRPPPISTLFPYTTLFRSTFDGAAASLSTNAGSTGLPPSCAHSSHARAAYCSTCTVSMPLSRSEEHTSELQSQFHLVCRLLLEKKKNNTITLILIHNNLPN